MCQNRKRRFLFMLKNKRKTYKNRKKEESHKKLNVETFDFCGILSTFRKREQFLVLTDSPFLYKS